MVVTFNQAGTDLTTYFLGGLCSLEAREAVAGPKPAVYLAVSHTNPETVEALIEYPVEK
jgi:hypothetical protein